MNTKKSESEKIIDLGDRKLDWSNIKADDLKDNPEMNEVYQFVGKACKNIWKPWIKENVPIIDMTGVDFKSTVEQNINHSDLLQRTWNLSANFSHCIKRTDECKWVIGLIKDMVNTLINKMKK